MARLPWFEDFNDKTVRAAPAVEELPAPPEPVPDPRLEAWTEGFLAGCRATAASNAETSQAITAELATRVAAIEDSLAAIADGHAATVGGLLLDILAAARPPEWPADALEAVVAAIRPIFALEPRLHVTPAAPGEVSFRDLPHLYKAMEAGDWELAVRWHQPGVSTDAATLADAIRQAIEPHEASAMPVPLASDEG
nr:hypothetical protein [uncultured Rhodopila sp.]